MIGTTFDHATAYLEVRISDTANLTCASCFQGVAENLYKYSEAIPRQTDNPKSKSHIRASKHRLGDEAITSAWELGRSMTFEQAVTYALEGTVETLTSE